METITDLPILTKEIELNNRDEIGQELHDVRYNIINDSPTSTLSTINIEEELKKESSKVALKNFVIVKIIERNSFSDLIVVKHNIDGKYYALKIFDKEEIFTVSKLQNLNVKEM